MSTERLYELAAEVTNRRRFLTKLGVAALGSFGLLLGLSTTALATYPYACCTLCQPAGPEGCAGCRWCWTCVDGIHTYRCCECHNPTTPCDASCENVTNSWYINLGCCAPGSATATVGM
jgi:hypothetical protein